jgi:RNA-directed DNA polymerase
MKNRTAGRGNYKMVRYADDFVVASNGTIAEVKAVKEELKDFLSTSLHLELSEEKTKITHMNDGIGDCSKDTGVLYGPRRAFVV